MMKLVLFDFSKDSQRRMMTPSEFSTEETGLPHMGKMQTLSPELLVLATCLIVSD